MIATSVQVKALSLIMIATSVQVRQPSERNATLSSESQDVSTPNGQPIEGTRQVEPKLSNQPSQHEQNQSSGIDDGAPSKNQSPHAIAPTYFVQQKSKSNHQEVPMPRPPHSDDEPPSENQALIAMAPTYLAQPNSRGDQPSSQDVPRPRPPLSADQPSSSEIPTPNAIAPTYSRVDLPGRGDQPSSQDVLPPPQPPAQPCQEKPLINHEEQVQQQLDTRSRGDKPSSKDELKFELKDERKDEPLPPLPAIPPPPPPLPDEPSNDPLKELKEAVAELATAARAAPLARLAPVRRPDLQYLSLFDGIEHGVKQRVLALAWRPPTPVGLDRAVGCLVGMAVADGIGHNFEFVGVQDVPPRGGPRLEPPSAEHPRGQLLSVLNRFELLPGQWTDDTSMALCMADSLLVRGGYDGADMRVWFWNWWNNGVNNAFRLDVERQQRRTRRRAECSMSVGLGANISKSLDQVTQLAEQGQPIPPRYEANTEDAGNGSIMRLAPVVLRYHGDAALARARAYESSLTTHPGRMAAEACALLAHLIVRALHRPAGNLATARHWLDAAVAEYEGILRQEPVDAARREVLRLLAAEEPDHSPERCWNWRSASLRFDLTLATRGDSYNGYPVTPQYFGAFSLDGLAMALHAFYTTSTFNGALVKVINMAGDADTTGAICAQLAGAFYGVSQLNWPWVEDMRKWAGYEIELRAIALYVAGIEPDPDVPVPTVC